METMNSATCCGCASVSEYDVVATHSIETWDAGDGMIVLDFCDDCYAGLEDACDRCGGTPCVNGFGICQSCLDDYNNGDDYGCQ